MNLSEYLAQWDPMGFIADLGAPSDEYNLESAEIRLGYRYGMSKSELADLIYEVFDKLVGVDLPGFRDECLRHAEEVKKILDSDQGHESIQPIRSSL